MQLFRAQGAIESFSGTTAGTQLGQGATEYLVLLAVVLIVALISVALLGFFPGMASDAQMTQSQTYWRSASPIAITEWGAQYSSSWSYVYPYLRVRNNGVYPIRITSIIGADGGKSTRFWSTILTCGAPSAGYYNISDYMYLAPGEEKTFGQYVLYGLACDRDVKFVSYASTGEYIGGATSNCVNSASSPGTAVFPSFGFE